MKAVLICVSRIDCLNSDGQECMKSIISEKMGECFCILCASAFWCSKLLMLCDFLSLKFKYCRNLLISSKLPRHSLRIFVF